MPGHGRGFSLTRLVVGLAIIAIGLLLSLDTLEMLDARSYLRYWPVILIAVGLTKIGTRKPADLVFAFFFVGLGLWLLLNALGYLDVQPWLYFWPFVLLLIGGFLVAGALRSRRLPAGEDDYVRGFALLGGLERNCSSPDFKGADLTAIMGVCEVDLRQATIVSGEAEIRILTFWGGVELRVPNGWRVDVTLWPILGGVGDETEQTPGPEAPVVTIKGAAIMGGVEIKN